MSKIAVIEAGGKQYVASEGAVLRMERVESSNGKVSFDKVLLVDDGSKVSIGTPHVSGATVTGEVIADGRAPKVTVIRYKAKSRYQKKRGHRQPYTTVKIVSL